MYWYSIVWIDLVSCFKPKKSKIAKACQSYFAETTFSYYFVPCHDGDGDGENGEDDRDS